MSIIIQHKKDGRTSMINIYIDDFFHALNKLSTL